MNFFKKNLAIFPLSCASKLNESDLTICVVNHKKTQRVSCHDLPVDSPAKRRRVSLSKPTAEQQYQLTLKTKLIRPDLENYKQPANLNDSIRSCKKTTNSSDVSLSDKSFYRKSSKYAKVTYRPVTFTKKPKARQCVNSNMKKRIGRQQDIAIETKYQNNPIPSFGDINCKLSNFKPTPVITKPVASTVKPLAPVPFLPATITKIDQLPTKPLRMGIRTLPVKSQQDKIDPVRKVVQTFPVMGVSAKIIKANKSKLVATKQWESDMNTTVDNIIKKDLTPFLDSCDFDELLPVPVVSSTFMTNKTFTKVVDAVDSIRSPVSIKSKARFTTVAPYFKV